MLDISTLTLSVGSHVSRDKGVCLLEAVAWFAGETHSDNPACCCPVLAEYGRAINDNAPQLVRDRLRDLIPRLVGTRAGIELERRRAYVLTDSAVRVLAPLAIEAVALPEQAATLRGLPEIVDRDAAARAAYAADAARVAAAADAAAAAAEAAARAAEAIAAERAASGAYAAVRAALRAALWAASVAGDTAWLTAIDSFERAIECE